MASAPARLVVADDDPDIRAMVAGKLRRAGHEVQAVGTGTEALELIRRWRPDLAVLDHSMPGMDGLDVCREVRRDPEVAETRIVMLTAHARGSDRETGLLAGVDDYLFKPFSPSDLVLRVHQVLAR